jgi:hypothetical protein
MLTYDTAKLEAGINKIVMLSLRSVDSFFKVAEEAIKSKYLVPLEQKISFEDHSLKALRALDHPYAKRHGSIQIGALGHEADIVHKQKRGLYGSLQLIAEETPAQVKARLEGEAKAKGGSGTTLIFSPSAPGSIVVTWKLVSSSEITKYVAEGTNRMLPRPFAQDVLSESGPAIIDEIRTNFRMPR